MANILTGVFIFFLLVGAFVIYANKKIAERDAQLKPKKVRHCCVLS